MDKASWIDAFVLRITELGGTSRKPGELAERLWPFLGDSDPVKVAEGQHALGDSRPGDFPDTTPDDGDTSE